MTTPRSPDPGPPILTLHDGVATLTLNRPQHLNRLHREDLLALRQHFAVLARDPAVRVLVITGRGRVFCSGYHLGDLEGGAQSAREDPLLFEQTVDALEALAMPTLARLNGGVYGGATDLALACDLRIGVDTMELRMPAARLGLHYYPSGLRRYVSRLGLQAAKRLFMLGETVGATELLRIGYLDSCVPADQLDAQLRSYVASLTANAPLALRAMKASLNEIARGGFDLPAMREREARCAASADLREGLAAFNAKRTPKFVGR